MGRSRTLKYQIGKYYTFKLNDDAVINSNWLVIGQKDYRKKDNSQGQKVKFQNIITNATMEREQQYY